ncbi:MAG: DUF2309 domain-containing protein [Hyphomicrobiales bacterium]
MNMHTDLTQLRSDAAIEAAERAARAIPPAWPLEATVAVNPFLGQTGDDLATAATKVQRTAGVRITSPRTWYAPKVASGEVSEADLASALKASTSPLKPASVAALKAVATAPEAAPAAIPTVADLATKASGKDWPALIEDRFGQFAASWFDQGQALWPSPHERGAYAEWRALALHDLTPEVAGFKGFAANIARQPETSREAIRQATIALGLAEEALDTYFHRLLMTLGGWSQVARYRLWQAELQGKLDTTVTDLLAIRLVWERLLHDRFGGEIADGWDKAKAAYAAPVEPSADVVADAILQDAVERSAQRALAAKLAAPATAQRGTRPALQAAFCIDVRSEVFRRALEEVDPAIDTIGFAGFFGMFTSHRRFASDVHEHRLPVLLNPSAASVAGGPDDREQDLATRYKARAKRAWGRFKLSAVSSFAFVEATGPVYAARLLRDALKVARPHKEEPAPQFSPALDPATRLKGAETILRAMSLTENFAPLVLLLGHGANVTNNPHASALHCGACGGYAGDVNARLLASLLNDRAVRDGLREKGIVIPDDTHFVGGLHDTTTDAVTLFAADQPSVAHAGDIARAKLWLEAAGRKARAERLPKLPGSTTGDSIETRSRDWSQTRPEWGLANCMAFIAAPRNRTRGRKLDGRSFLHDYDWQKDQGFGVLELIMTAPVVVASWISLQYYGSTVAPSVFGGGNKLVHNVVGGVGVLEGNGGSLRTGLPLQSVHDGEKFVHEPLRLTVAIEAPREAMTAILEKHDGVRALFDNGWLTLFALDEEGKMAWRYAGGLVWERV